MKKLSDVLNRESNNFALAKLLLIIFVIWNHSFALSSVGGRSHLILVSFNVALFGFISGLLITNSLIKNQSISRFFVRSVVRLYVPYAIAVLSSAFIFAPMVADLHLLSAADLMAYVKSNLLLKSTFQIPNVLVGHRNLHGINGSLWCMPVFFCMYALAGAAFLLNKFKGFGTSFAAVTLLTLLLFASYFKLGDALTPRLISRDNPTLLLSIGFCLGMVFRCCAARIPLRGGQFYLSF